MERHLPDELDEIGSNSLARSDQHACANMSRAGAASASAA